MSDLQNARLATLVALAEKYPKLGRTALMKLCYFLQTLRKVPLGYRFTLYSYGPFDSSVLSDLSSAEALGGLDSDIVFYPSGYGYEIQPSDLSESVKALDSRFLKKHKADIHWVVKQFAKFGSADLELLSTIVYVDREYARAKKRITADSLAGEVHEVKPRFTKPYIREKVGDLHDRGLLRSLGKGSAKA